jgi:hypothetical protein
MVASLIAVGLFAANVSIDVNTAAIFTLIGAIIAAYPSARLVGANRKKVLAEVGTTIDARAEAAAKLFAADNKTLRDRVSDLESKLDATERRCDALEHLLLSHGVPIPD